MKKVYLLRHAKAASGGFSMDDHDRPLKPRGREDAPKMAAALKELGHVPDVILCSSASRAQETCEHFHATLGEDIPVRELDDLYLAPEMVILGVLRKLGACDRVLVIGHNPGLEVLASKLGRNSTAPKFPTCAFAAFEFDVKKWRDIELGAGELVDFLTPKMLRD